MPLDRGTLLAENERMTSRLLPVAPAVSVIIPCYRQAHYLAESVGSLIAQSHRDWECIVVDDGSPDDTAEVVRALIAQNPERRIRLLRQANQGLGAARNSGIRASMGRYILPLDADDRLAPEMLERCVALLDARPGISIAFTDAQLFGVQGHRWNTGPFTLEAELQDNRIPYCSLYRRGVWDAVGGYDPTRRLSHEDWEFWLHALKRGFRGERIAEPLFHYRTAAASMVTECNAQRPKMLGILALNHPGLFGAAREREARALLGDEANPVFRPAFTPTVSVVLPIRGESGALEESLASVLQQSFQDFEVLVINDGGATVDARIAALDTGGKVQSIRIARAGGPGAARNLGLQAARGRYIAYIHEGERYLPQHLQRLVELLAQSGQRVAYSDAQEAVRTRQGTASHETALHRCGPFDPDALLFEACIPLCCLMHARDCTDPRGGGDSFDCSLALLEDWDFTLRLAQRLAFAHLPEATCLIQPAANPGSAEDETLRQRTRAMVEEKHAERRAAAVPRCAAARAAIAARYQALLPSIEAAVAAGEPARAAAALEEFISTYRGCAEAHNDLAAVLQGLGRRQQALLEARRAAALEPDSEAIASTLAIVQLGLGDIEGAARTLKPALHRAPRDGGLLAIAAQISRAARNRTLVERPPAQRIEQRRELLVLAFSRDRQMQLDATLRSLQQHGRDIQRGDIKVLTKATTERHRALYQTLASEHPRVELIEERDFRAQLLGLLGGYRQILFLVDDNLVVRPFALAEASRALELDESLLGASLRLGRNTIHCYTMHSSQRVPPMAAAGICPSMNRFRWVGAEHDFGYPLEVSSSLYRVGDIEPLLQRLAFRNPNQLEAAMAREAPAFAASKPDLLCFENSVTFCNPVNIVQTTFTNNRAGNALEESPAALAERYAAGERIDI